MRTPHNTPDDGPTDAVRASNAISAQYTADCPTCGAKGATINTDPAADTARIAGQPCRSKTTGRVTDTHRARIEAQYQR